jgi:tRNA(His) guanylyltransferase
LVWLAESERSDVFFSGKVQKMCSVLTSMTAAKFATVIPAEYRDRLPHFGARVLKLPSKEEAMNTFLWRAMDARKNAISMVAQSRFSAKTLYGKDQAAMLAMLAMLAEAGVDFESYPVCFRRGSFVRRRLTERSLTDNELAQIPEMHRPSGPVIRAEYAVLDVPPFHKVANRVGVIFDGEEPATQ